MLPFYNALISTTRDGTAVLVNHRCQIEWPTVGERIMAQGAQVPVQVYDAPDVDYRSGDILTLVAVDGHEVGPHPSRYSVGVVERLGAPLALTRVQLVGYGGASS